MANLQRKVRDDGSTEYWYRHVLLASGFTPTGYKLTTEAGSWEMRKAAIELNTPLENLTAFKTEEGWEHFLLPHKTLGGGYVDHPVLPPPTREQIAASTPPEEVKRVRCLTLWQPWASLLAGGHKFIETRSWNTQIRGEIYIHAAGTKRPVRELFNAPEDTPRVRLFEEKLGIDRADWDKLLPYGAIVGKGKLNSTAPIESCAVAYPDQIPFGNFDPGRFGHVYADLRPISLIPWKGGRGFFFADLPV